MILGILFLTGTLLYPLKETYALLKQDSRNNKNEQLWAVYWGFFSILLLLRCVFPFLNIKAVEAVILAFSVWLYHNQYRGALYLKKKLLTLLNNNEITKAVLTSVKQWNDLLHIIETGEQP